jgi:hypothetical protein
VIAGRWFVSPHAVRRLGEMGRWQGQSYERRLAHLIRLSAHARRVRELHPGVWLYRVGRDGQSYRRRGEERLRLVVSEREAGPGRLPVLVTVLNGRRHKEGRA